MVFHSQIFWGCLGGVIIWIFVWSTISTHVKKGQPYSNRWMNKLASNMELIAILPMIPVLLVYAVYLRFLFDPLKTSVKGRFVRRNERRQVVKLRGAFGAQRLIWAMEDLEHVRREKMPLVEEVEVLGSDGEISTVKSPLHTIKGQGFQFESLPAELRIHIYSLLDYGTALRLAQVNRFFYYDRPFNSIDREQRVTFLYYADSFARNKGRLACYECLRVRSRSDFLPEHRSGDLDRFGNREMDRRCYDCVVKIQDVEKKRLWGFAFRRWKARTFHRTTDRRETV